MCRNRVLKRDELESDRKSFEEKSAALVGNTVSLRRADLASLLSNAFWKESSRETISSRLIWVRSVRHHIADWNMTIKIWSNNHILNLTLSTEHKNQILVVLK